MSGDLAKRGQSADGVLIDTSSTVIFIAAEKMLY